MADINDLHRAPQKQEKQTKTLPRVTRHAAAKLALAATGFFLGRVVVFGTVNPIASAFLAAFWGGGTFYTAAAFTAFGFLTRTAIPYSIKYFLTIACMVGGNALLRGLRRDKPLPSIIPPVSAGMSALAAGLLVALANGVNPYLLLMALLEGVLAFSVGLIMQKGIAALIGNVRRGALSNEELISLAVLAGGIATGAADIFLGLLSLRYFTCVLLVLLMSQSGGASVGAAVGLLLGTLMNVAGFEGMAFPVIMGVAGLTSGGLRDVNKPFAAIGCLLAGAILCLYFAPGLLSLELLVSALAGAAVFCFLPNRFMANIFQTVNPQADAASVYLGKMKLLTTHRLLGFANALHKLSATFGGLTGKKSALSKREVHSLIDDAAADACEDCPRRETCWEENVGDTLRVALGLLADCEMHGASSPDRAPSDFRVLCVAPDRFCRAVNHTYMLYKSGLAWRNKLVESRALVSEQLGTVSHIMQNLAQSLDTELDFKSDLERKIINLCNLRKLDVSSVLVMRSAAALFEVTIERAPDADTRHTTLLVTSVSQVLGRRMTIEEETRLPGGAASRLLLLEEHPFSVSCAIAATAKTGARESGDSHSFLEMKNGKCLLALSDGMGSGRRARMESAAAIDLLEEFIEAGFDVDAAIGLINSALLLKSGDELFSTLDICLIDLRDGAAEFIKIGASTTFLLHDSEVDIIRSWTLPVGILQSVDADMARRRLKHGDMLVMVTDGVLDSDLHGFEKEDWILQALREFPASNPQDLADHLLQCAVENYNNVVQDDMTVLVARIWEKAV